MRSRPNLVLAGHRSPKANSVMIVTRGLHGRRLGLVAAPPKLAAIRPHAMQDDRELACHRHCRAAQASPFGNCRSPGLQCRPSCNPGQQAMRGDEQSFPCEPVAALADRAVAIDLARGVFARCQPEMCANVAGSGKPCRVINRCCKGQGAGFTHQPALMAEPARQPRASVWKWALMSAPM